METTKKKHTHFYFLPKDDFAGWWDTDGWLPADELEACLPDNAFTRIWVIERSPDGNINNDAVVGATTLLTEQVRASLQADDGLFWAYGTHTSTYEDCWENIAVFQETWDDEHTEASQAVAAIQLDHIAQLKEVAMLARRMGIQLNNTETRLKVVE